MYYETIFIVNPDVSKENTETLTDALVKRVEKASGRIVKREYWGSRPLAYQIAKRKRGHYVMLVTDGEHAAVQTLEEGLRLEERVLRFLTSRLQELSDEPSPLLRRQIKSAESVRNEDKPAEEHAAKEKVEAATADTRNDVTPISDTAEKQPVKEDTTVEAGGDAAA
ncbi:MAG: 30S ribosomal protein S6 [Mariprofundaceae bacterium]|nr:30S ribosomal protein S6 [Mariprofundaceae bacterium]